jgi:hypothetical protein
MIRFFTIVLHFDVFSFIMTLNHSVHKHIQKIVTDLVVYLRLAQITAACNNESNDPSAI